MGTGMVVEGEGFFAPEVIVEGEFFFRTEEA